MKAAQRFFLLILSAFLVSCASTPKKIPTERVSEYAVEPVAQARQTKSNVTIQAEVLRPSESYSHPELFAFAIKQFPESHYNFSTMSTFPEDAQGKRWCYTFGFGDSYLTALKVKFTNNTPHILRMKDARIYLVVEGESPITAVTELGNANLIPVTTSKGKEKYLPKSYVNEDNSLIHWLTHFENEWDKSRKKGMLSFTYPIGFAALVVKQNSKQYKLINDLAVEILPNFSHEGILLFPAIVSWPQAKLMFYDITTKTDPAGNPIEKTTFEFPLALKEVDMWFDRAEKRWKKGLPPAVGTAGK